MAVGGSTMENNRKPFDLEDRLVDFAVNVLTVCEFLPSSKVGQNLDYQLSKSGTSCALNYGEAQSAESPEDFIHKLKIVLKELHETRICFKIIQKKYLPDNLILKETLNECFQLIAIFLKSVETAKKNRDAEKQKRKSREV
jgi:four helix bundle protein